MDHRIEKTVEKLPKAKNVNAVWAELDRRMADGDVSFLGDLGVELLRRSVPGSARVWQYESVLDRAIRLLALAPGGSGVEQLLRLVAGEDRSARKRARYVASLIASAQDADALRPLFRGARSGAGASNELRACTVHELVVRGIGLTDLPEALNWASGPGIGRHPLAWLPLRRSEPESGADLPSYSVQGSTSSLPFGPINEVVRPLPLRSGQFAALASEAADLSSVPAAVANWADESNGRIEARAFDLEHPLDEPDIPQALLGLGLDCLAGHSRRTDFSVARSAAGAAWSVLFAAASSGGAYNHGLYGAYGRLAAWRSLGGLAGAGVDTTASEVEERAATCGWYRFGAATPWYHNVAWDIGLATLDQERTRVTVLAATDTD
ncbi:hypothetical protein DDQ41_12395 [Streptomyces spongiicola]|uniref:Uncharacterized protein n=1 Tax=Streptomyces spongiicola TaxID=1690221 RepID=A0ABM6VG78_9ACTN|nr:DUF6183 family protein [Streptomyces spongiicola]AWK12874.1 hypothetical protein DDQ41_12395 [Streptomyces spongiicola]